jgi:integrase
VFGTETGVVERQAGGKVLSAPFSAAQRLGYIVTNPRATVEPFRDHADAARDTFTPEQLSRLANAAEDEWKGVILCGYFHGLRLRDVAELRWSGVDLTAGTLRIKMRKTGAILVLPLHEQFAGWLRTQPRGIGQAPIFPTLREGCDKTLT